MLKLKPNCECCNRISRRARDAMMCSSSACTNPKDDVR